MSTYIARGLPTCDACFQCSLCERVACANNEVVLCAHGDEPCCDDCCSEHHGGQE